MKTSKPYFALIGVVAYFSSAVLAATTDDLIERINTKQSKNVNYMLTLEEIEQLESSADPVAHYFLGLVYAEGNTFHTPRDQCKAAEHMEISAKGGYPYAQLYLGYANLWGIGLEPNPNNAVAWYGQAQQTLISATLKGQKPPFQPYNAFSSDVALDRSLRCSADLLELLDKDENGQVNQPTPNVYAKPCITDNIAGPAPNPLFEKLPSGRIGIDEGKPDLGWWCPLKPHQDKDMSRPE